jgi:hypothetical protein
MRNNTRGVFTQHHVGKRHIGKRLRPWTPGFFPLLISPGEGAVLTSSETKGLGRAAGSL